MKSYEKPIVTKLEGKSESIYMASGASEDEAEEKVVCRFGRSNANPGSDTCQACCKSGGLLNKVEGGTFRNDFTECIEGLPLKEDSQQN